jgi:hypothetical protein
MTAPDKGARMKLADGVQVGHRMVNLTVSGARDILQQLNSQETKWATWDLLIACLVLPEYCRCHGQQRVQEPCYCQWVLTHLVRSRVASGAGRAGVVSSVRLRRSFIAPVVGHLTTLHWSLCTVPSSRTVVMPWGGACRTRYLNCGRWHYAVWQAPQVDGLMGTTILNIMSL